MVRPTTKSADSALTISRNRDGNSSAGSSENGYYTPSLRRQSSGDSLRSISSKSEGYSELEDISELILQAPIPACENPPPITTSATILGKRKASAIPEPESRPRSKPFYTQKTAISIADDDNPFIEKPKIAPEVRINDLDAPVVIAHSSHLQRCFDSRKLPYGVQYEIARLVTIGRLRYEDILLADLDKLRDKGPNVHAAPMTAKILLHGGNPGSLMGHTLTETEDHYLVTAFAKEIAARSPWEELDMEERALQKNPYAGLGFSEECPDWYGGKIQFRGRLHDLALKKDPPRYKIVLERAELGPSCRFTRRFGSKSFLRISIPKTIFDRHNNYLVQYFSHPFILSGSVFRAFFAKEDNVFLVKTNEEFDGLHTHFPEKGTSGATMSFLEFLEWHNPLEFNQNQAMTKWSTRFALGLSNSAPGIRLQPSEIVEIPDIVSADGSDMTDGAGEINKAGIRPIFYKFSFQSWPTAIQFRVGGAKGLLVQHPNDMQETPCVGLRPSQIKIKYPATQTPDPAMLTVDLLRSSHARTPSRLSAETIINLAENGVPTSAFIELIQEGLKAIVTPLMKWEGPGAMRDLWVTLARCGGVMTARLGREEAGEARLKGYRDREIDDIETNDEDGFQQLDEGIDQRSSVWWGDQISGCPSSLEETVMGLLDSGFTPQNCPVLRDKLEIIIKSNINRFTRSYRIDVPMSCMSFLVPDTQGVLEPGEVQFKSSKRNLKTADGLDTDIILGDVLITRHPCKLPTDIQKWKAVERLELRNRTDVIVCSIKGPRRAADLLAGGDYDGDKGLLLYQPELVQNFTNAPLHFSVAPDSVAPAFSRNNEKVSDFLLRTASSPQNARVHATQKFLLGALRDTSVVGSYSIYHSNAIYTLGYRHHETIRLAYMFCSVLDASKTGLTVLQDVIRNDRKRYQKRGPEWRETPEVALSFYETNQTPLARPAYLGPFIMDSIFHHAKKEGARKLQEIEAIFSASGHIKPDADLIAPWLAAHIAAERWVDEEKNNRRTSDLAKIEKHVHLMYDAHHELFSQSQSPKRDRDKGPVFTSFPIEVRQEKLRTLSKKYASMPLPSELLMDEIEVATVKASYAYFYDTKQNKYKGKDWTSFPWDVAMRELCAIKARASGPSKMVMGEFYDKFSMKLSSASR